MIIGALRRPVVAAEAEPVERGLAVVARERAGSGAGQKTLLFCARRRAATEGPGAGPADFRTHRGTSTKRDRPRLSQRRRHFECVDGPDARRGPLAHQVGVQVLPGAVCWVYIVSCTDSLLTGRTEHCTYITTTTPFTASLRRSTPIPRMVFTNIHQSISSWNKDVHRCPTAVHVDRPDGCRFRKT